MVATINILIGDWSQDIYNPKVASFVEKFLFKLPYDKVLTVSEYAKQSLLNDFNVKAPISVVYNGVDLEEIDSIKASKSEKKTIIFSGRMVWFKYPEDLVESIQILKQEIPDIVLKFVGDGQKMGMLQKKVKTLHLGKEVEFWGKLDHKYTIANIKMSDVLVLPSLKDTFGIVVVEAMACGVPVVAYDCAGPREIITEDVGLLAKPRDVEDLANKIKAILVNKKLAEIIGKNGRKKVEQKFTWDKVVENYLEVIR